MPVTFPSPRKLLRAWLHPLTEGGCGIETTGNNVQLFFSGDEAFSNMLDAISSARDSVHMEMYHFSSDPVGWQFATTFAEKARTGVAVRITYDAIGSLGVDPDMHAYLRDAGAEVHPFRPVAPWRKRSGILGRNHRKNLIIDGQTAFTGGMNIGQDWSRKHSGDKAWRDTHIRIDGPAARACDHFFRESWKKAGGSDLPPPPREPIPPKGQSDIMVVGGRDFAKRRAIRRLYSLHLEKATSHVRLTVPYFAPPGRLLRKLSEAAERLQNVEVLVPRDSDAPIADWIREGLYPGLLEKGTRFHEYTGSILHAKTMTVDHALAVVGSANFDLLSFSMNWELALVIEDPQVVQALEKQYQHDLTHSSDIGSHWKNRRPVFHRLIARLAAAILRKL